jgi:hypothetical protein
MKFFPSGAAASAFLATGLCVLPGISLSCFAQSGQTTPAPVPQTTAPSTPQPTAPSGPASTGPASTGTVIFSRSTDENGKTTTVAPGANPSASQTTGTPTATDAERLAVAFTALDLDVHLQTAAQQIAVRALVSIRNDGKAPLTRIPLQISSSLQWEQIRIAGRTIPFTVATLNSDTDHTGQLHEASVSLPTPLAPGAALQLDVAYSGSVEPTAKRLVSLGTPEDVARHSDWDEISPSFTGLRGFGNVVWYPVASIPVFLGDGSRLFDEIGRHKLALSHAHFRLRLTAEFPHGQPPTVALINGLPAPLTVNESQVPDPDLAGIATASIDTPSIGFLAPSLFLAVRTPHPGPNLTAFTVPDNDISMQSWLDEAAGVTPFLQSWLGHQPRTQLNLLDLPDPSDAPFETGALLATSLHTGPADPLDTALVHAFTHAYTLSASNPAPAWFNEGLATFVESLWVEKQHGRERALEMLENDRSALALLEPSSPGDSAGTPLPVAIAPVYYRTKAAYVFWMLRDLTSDEALSRALSAWVAEPPSQSTVASLPSLLKQAGVNRDLAWFFADWIDTDKGLPDLTIENVFPNAAQAGSYLVAVNVINTGYAAADVPLTVRTAKNFVTETIFVPAHGRAVKRLVVLGPPTQVQLNDGTVPEIQASVHVSNIAPPATDQPSSTQSAPANSSSSTTEPPPQ